MTLGVMLDEEHSDQLMYICTYLDEHPYHILAQAITTMYNKIREDDVEED